MSVHFASKKLRWATHPSKIFLSIFKFNKNLIVQSLGITLICKVWSWSQCWPSYGHFSVWVLKTGFPRATGHYSHIRFTQKKIPIFRWGQDYFFDVWWISVFFSKSSLPFKKSENYPWFRPTRSYPGSKRTEKIGIEVFEEPKCYPQLQYCEKKWPAAWKPCF